MWCRIFNDRCDYNVLVFFSFCLSSSNTDLAIENFWSEVFYKEIPGFNITRGFAAIIRDRRGIHGHSSFEVKQLVKIFRIIKKRGFFRLKISTTILTIEYVFIVLQHGGKQRCPHFTHTLGL
ncbi:uncharacterized protein ACN427_010864 isoform 3-T4 [Glossina fuscipes fuscipes]